jgi:hypothetical protein
METPMESNYVSACGLTCCDCLFYKNEFFQAAKTMKRLIDEYRFDVFFNSLSKSATSEAIAAHLRRDGSQLEAMFRVFEHMPDFVRVLEGLIYLECQHTCREGNGCSIGGTPHQCAALECVNSKGLDGCWKCAEYKTCDKLGFQRKSYGKTVTDNLDLLERAGTTSLRARGNQYYEWQRQMIRADETR